MSFHCFFLNSPFLWTDSNSRKAGIKGVSASIFHHRSFQVKGQGGRFCNVSRYLQHLVLVQREVSRVQALSESSFEILKALLQHLFNLLTTLPPSELRPKPFSVPHTNGVSSDLKLGGTSRRSFRSMYSIAQLVLDNPAKTSTGGFEF